MSINRRYMGKIFLAPMSQQPKSDGTTLYINIGFNSQGNQVFPAWIPALEPAVGKEAYDALMAKLKSYLDANGVDNCLMYTSCILAPLCIGLICCGIMAAQGSKITGDLKEMAEKESWVSSLILTQMASPQAQTPDFTAYDQYGAPLKALFGQSKHSRRNDDVPVLC